MQAGVHVASLEALIGMRAAVCLFREEADQSLGMLQSEIDRFVDWLEHDQLAFWRHEIRRCEERLAEAKTDLHRCLAATIDPERTPSCYQEKKVVAAAKRQLEEAEEKLAAVRRWIPLVRQAVFEYRLKVEPLASAAAVDLPRAVSVLDRTMTQIQAYLDVAPPTAGEATSGVTTPGAATLTAELPPHPQATVALPATESAAKTADEESTGEESTAVAGEQAEEETADTAAAPSHSAAPP